MTDIFAAREMAMSLAFHIIFACVGIAMPLLIVIAERNGKAGAVVSGLAQRWAKGTASSSPLAPCPGRFFPLSWACYGQNYGTCRADHRDAIFDGGLCVLHRGNFLGIYLYGWKKVSPRAHLLRGSWF